MTADGPPIDWDYLFRGLTRRCRLTKAEIGKLTFEQAINLLDETEPNDPHRDNMPIDSLEDLRRSIEEEW